MANKDSPKLVRRFALECAACDTVEEKELHLRRVFPNSYLCYLATANRTNTFDNFYDNTYGMYSWVIVLELVPLFSKLRREGKIKVFESKAIKVQTE